MLLLDIVHSFIRVCDIPQFITNSMLLVFISIMPKFCMLSKYLSFLWLHVSNQVHFYRELLRSVVEVVTPKFIFHYSTLTPTAPSINSDEAKCYSETSYYIADMLTEVLIFFSSFSSWILKEPTHEFVLSGGISCIFFHKIIFI